MKKLSILFSLLLAATMILAACGGSGQDTAATESFILATALGNEATSDGAQTTPMLTETGTPLGAGTMATEDVSGAATEAVGGVSGTEFGTPAGVGLTGTPGAVATTDANATQPVATAAAGETGTPAAGATAVGQTPNATVAATETVSSTEAMTNTLVGAAIEPADARRFLILLSNWQGFTLADQDGETVGLVSDYIINLCEAHIVYMVVETDGGQMLVPYEAVSVNSGTIDAEGGVITINVPADQTGGAPTLEQLPDLTATDWETGVRDYWGGVVSLSSLGGGCNVTATATQTAPNGQNLEGATVTKLVYASALRGAALQDGNETPLGTVRDAVIEPESGQIFYLAVTREGTYGQSSVLVPVAAVNLADTQQPEGPATLVLLVDTAVLQEAPAIASLGDLTTNEDPAAHDYWSQYVQLGPGSVSPTTP